MDNNHSGKATDMVSVPRELLQRLISATVVARGEGSPTQRDAEALLIRPAEQRQGESVAWLHKMHATDAEPRMCLLFTEETPWAKDAQENPGQRHEAIPLFQAPVEAVEAIAWYEGTVTLAINNALDEVAKLRAQLAERDALLREARAIPLLPELSRRIDDALSASAEPKVKP